MYSYLINYKIFNFFGARLLQLQFEGFNLLRYQ